VPGRLSALLVLLALLWAGAADAQGTRIGYVDMKRLLDNAPQVLEARARLAREFSERDQRLKADEQRLAESEARQKREQAVLSKADAEKLAAEIDALRRGTQRAREQLRDELARRSKEELDKRWPEVLGVVVEAPVLYASPSVDITDAVLERLRRPPAGAGAQR